MSEAAYKVCPKCQFKSSAQKNYCDRCGTELPSSGGATRPPAGAPDQIIPQTVIRRAPTPGTPGAPANPPTPNLGAPEGFALPQAGRSQQSFEAPKTKPPTQKKTASKAKPGPGRLERTRDALEVGASSLWYVLKSAAAIVFLMALALGAFLLYTEHKRMESPAFAAKATAETYLEMMRGGDYANAYTMLTQGAQQMTTLDEFRQARDNRHWKWSAVRPAKLEADAAVMAYDLSIENGAPQTDYLSLVLVGKKWLRPFNATLLQKADLALRSNDPDMAVLHSQAAVNVDPRDPLARSFLCEADYFRRLLPDADRECRMALDLSGKYPSKLEPRALRHVTAVLADTQRAMGKPGDAAVLYDQILAAPELTTPERCDALKARAAARQALGQNDAAKADLDAAATCPNP